VHEEPWGLSLAHSSVHIFFPCFIIWDRVPLLLNKVLALRRKYGETLSVCSSFGQVQGGMILLAVE